jgi:hypothetical protein
LEGDDDGQVEGRKGDHGLMDATRLAKGNREVRLPAMAVLGYWAVVQWLPYSRVP